MPGLLTTTTCVILAHAVQVVLGVKNPPTTHEMQETRVQSLDREDPLEEEMATHPGILPERSHRQRRLVGCGPGGHVESDTAE